MTAVTVFRSKKPEIVGVEFDLRISEVHTLTATPTLFPVEGTQEDIVEHIILNPREVVVEAYISNVDDDNRALGENAKNALIELDAIRVERAPLDLVTEHVAYTNMILTGIDADHPGLGPQDKGSLKYTLSFQQIIILATNTVLTPAAQLDSTVVKSASSEINSGKKDATIL